MATAEQMQGALQQLQVLGARIAALETQLQLESARAQTAERERSALTQTLGAMRTDRGGAMVDTTGIGQPFMLKGTADQDFGEWTHRVRTFMLGRFGEQILGALIWHHVNGKSLSKVADLRRETASYTGLEKVEKVPMRRTRSTRSMISLESSTHTLSLSQPTQPTRRRQRLGSLETTAQRVRPHVVQRRVAILQQVQNPPRCQRVEDMGAALEDWLSKKCQYEMFTDRNGRPCQASDDSLVAAMFRLMPKSLEETVMFADEDEGFQELFDRLLANSSTKQSIQMSESKKPTRKDDPVDVDALSKGKSEGKGKKGKRPKPHEQRQVLELRQDGSLLALLQRNVVVKRQKAKAKCKVTNMLIDGFGVVSMLTHGGRRQTGRQDLVQDVDDSKRSDTLRIRRTSRRI